MPAKTNRLLPRLRRWHRRARWARERLARVPLIVQIAGGVAMLLAVAALVNPSAAAADMRQPLGRQMRAFSR